MHEAFNYDAFTQRDLIDLFVEQAADEGAHMSFSVSSMQARLEKAKQTKSQFRALVQKRGGLAGVVRQLTAALDAQGQSHLQRSPLMLSTPKAISKQRPSQNQREEGDQDVSRKEEEEKVDESSDDSSGSSSDSGDESHSIAKAARRFLHQGKTSASFKASKKYPEVKLGAVTMGKHPTSSKPDLVNLRPASPVATAGSAEKTRSKDTTNNLPTSKETVTTEPVPTERRRRRSVDIRLESRNSQHDAQVIMNAVAIARTREGKLQRGNSNGGALSMH